MYAVKVFRRENQQMLNRESRVRGRFCDRALCMYSSMTTRAIALNSGSGSGNSKERNKCFHSAVSAVFYKILYMQRESENKRG
jgi:hypothetical protein